MHILFVLWCFVLLWESIGMIFLLYRSFDNSYKCVSVGDSDSCQPKDARCVLLDIVVGG
jgi:hypothetical protein